MSAEEVSRYHEKSERDSLSMSEWIVLSFIASDAGMTDALQEQSRVQCWNSISQMGSQLTFDSN